MELLRDVLLWALGMCAVVGLYDLAARRWEQLK